ncbi:MAG TPA: c-type cytochrome [Anaeromyxobacter sp.]
MSRHAGAAVACLLALLGLASGLSPVLAQKAEAKKLNPYTGNEEAIREGRKLYLRYGCAGCHGVGGGGGMGPAVTDDEWKFGSDDEVLMKLVKGEIPEQRMPKVFGALTEDEIWKILAYVRSQYAGDPSKVDW